ncbi:nucleoside hydrolase-like domain-containing protein [Duganella sp. SG902]|uniref:nucleoside hydrolase-like domain-containing protein n=1 Tax=Duganella sp. SG902 TaxID=2587016 RepID=UPI00159D6571
MDGGAPAHAGTTARRGAQEARQRLFVLTDIEADPDDTQSLIRLMLYANQFDIEGIVATTSVHMKNVVHPDAVRSVIRRYGQVRPNLLKHESGYCLPANLVQPTSCCNITSGGVFCAMMSHGVLPGAPAISCA